MLTTDNRRYAADEGCFIVRKSDQKIMGEAIDLGSDDNIENYEDQAKVIVSFMLPSASMWQQKTSQKMADDAIDVP